MKNLIPLSLLAASQYALAYEWHPVHGCEWLTDSTDVRNFTLFNGAPDTNTSSSVYWEVPVHDINCTVSAATSIPPIGQPTVVPCLEGLSVRTNGQFRVLVDNELEKSVALILVAYQGCASNVYTFYYRADFVVQCERGADGSELCVPKGNSTAKVTNSYALYPYSPDPPPPYW